VSLNFKISEVTISKTFNKIEPYRNIVINDRVVDKLVSKIDADAKKQKLSDEVKARMTKFGISYEEDKIDHVKINILDDDEDLEFNEDDLIESDKIDKLDELLYNAKYMTIDDDFDILVKSQALMKDISKKITKKVIMDLD